MVTMLPSPGRGTHEQAACYADTGMTVEQKKSLETALWVNPNRMSGTPCFRDTRVPVQSLIDLLEGGETIDQFLTLYPDVSRAQVLIVLDAANSQILECASLLTSA